MRGIQQSRAGNDRRAVLVIVEDRDVHLLAQALLHDKALGGLDVLQIDRAEGGLHGFDHLDERLGLRHIQLDIDDVHIRINFEEQPLALHHRLGRPGADIPESQHGGAIADDSHEIAASGVLGGGGRIRLDGATRLRHSRRVRQGQVIDGKA